MLSGAELSVFLILLVLTAGILLTNYLKKDPVSFWSPMTIVALVYSYYVIAGPIQAILNGETLFRAVEHRGFVLQAWGLCLVSQVAMLIGFNATRSGNRQRALKETKSTGVETIFGKRLFLIGFFFLLVIAGTGGLAAQINFMDAGYSAMEGYQGAFANYFYHGISFFITAACLLLISLLKNRQNLIWLVLVVLLALAIFTRQGFRYRHVLLGLSLVSTFYLYKGRKPNPVLLGSLAVVGITIMGIIGLTRAYNRGLQLQGIEGRSQEELFWAGFGESQVFLSTGLLYEQVPDVFEHIGFDPIIQSVTMPIPRVLWPGKPAGDYIEIYQGLYGEIVFGIGVAVLNVGEYYLAFGWAGVIIGSFLIGFFYGKLWNWFKRNRTDPVAIVLYSITASFLYIIISRGYLPQVAMLFVFTVGPAWYVWRVHTKRLERQARYAALRKKLDQVQA